MWVIAQATYAIEPKDLVGTWRNQWGMISELHADRSFLNQFIDEQGAGRWKLRPPNILEFQNYGQRPWHGVITGYTRNRLYFKGPEGREVWTRLK